MVFLFFVPAEFSKFRDLNLAEIRARKKAHKLRTHKLFESRGQPWDNPPVNQRDKFIFRVSRGEHINFLARLTLGQLTVCPRAIWTFTRAKSLCLCSLLLPEKSLSLSLSLWMFSRDFSRRFPQVPKLVEHRPSFQMLWDDVL